METLLIDQAMMEFKEQNDVVATHAMLRQPVVLIPAYKPGNAICVIARQLIESGEIQALIIVDDGSGAEYDGTFAELSTIGGVHLLRHELNRGKGAALKTGLSFIEKKFPLSFGVVTADADGQHDPLDVIKVALELIQSPDSLILGARSFKGNIPLRSRFGNELTRHVLSLFAHQKLQDTQTGLRGIPTHLISVFRELQPNGYDYELAMLITSKRLGVQFKEVDIRTIYIDCNSSSHFKPLHDSVRIYLVFLKFAAVSLLSALIDNLIFIVAWSLGASLLISQVSARTVALLFNYFANKSAVFHSQAKVTRSIPLYLGLASFLLLASYSLIYMAVYWCNINVMIAKISVESFLFIMSFTVQKLFVFNSQSSWLRLRLMPKRRQSIRIH